MPDDVHIRMMPKPSDDDKAYPVITISVIIFASIPTYVTCFDNTGNHDPGSPFVIATATGIERVSDVIRRYQF